MSQYPPPPQAGLEPPRNPKADAKAAKAYAKASRPWYKKKRWLALGAFLLIIAISVGSSSGDAEDPSTAGDAQSSEQRDDSEPAPEGGGGGEPAPEPEPEMTSGQENALAAAENYIDIMPFSKAGLIRQLSSSAGDGYSKADATFAANNVDADWNEEAVEAAQNYLDTMPFSRDGLIEQLSSSAGDQYTPEQARYAVNQVF